MSGCKSSKGHRKRRREVSTCRPTHVELGFLETPDFFSVPTCQGSPPRLSCYGSAEKALKSGQIKSNQIKVEFLQEYSLRTKSGPDCRDDPVFFCISNQPLGFWKQTKLTVGRCHTGSPGPLRHEGRLRNLTGRIELWTKYNYQANRFWEGYSNSAFGGSYTSDPNRGKRAKNPTDMFHLRIMTRRVLLGSLEPINFQETPAIHQARMLRCILRR